MKRKGVVNIGDTDINADWIKTEENRRTEREIHNRLAQRTEKWRKEKK